MMLTMMILMIQIMVLQIINLAIKYLVSKVRAHLKLVMIVPLLNGVTSITSYLADLSSNQVKLKIRLLLPAICLVISTHCQVQNTDFARLLPFLSHLANNNIKKTCLSPNAQEIGYHLLHFNSKYDLTQGIWIPKLAQ